MTSTRPDALLTGIALEQDFRVPRLNLYCTRRHHRLGWYLTTPLGGLLLHPQTWAVTSGARLAWWADDVPEPGDLQPYVRRRGGLTAEWYAKRSGPAPRIPWQPSGTAARSGTSQHRSRGPFYPGARWAWLRCACTWEWILFRDDLRVLSAAAAAGAVEARLAPSNAQDPTDQRARSEGPPPITFLDRNGEPIFT